MSRPGVEPGLPLPQSGVITTRPTGHFFTYFALIFVNMGLQTLPNKSAHKNARPSQQNTTDKQKNSTKGAV